MDKDKIKELLANPEKLDDGLKKSFAKWTKTIKGM